MISSDLYILSLEGKKIFPDYVMKSRQPAESGMNLDQMHGRSATEDVNGF